MFESSALHIHASLRHLCLSVADFVERRMKKSRHGIRAASLCLTLVLSLLCISPILLVSSFQAASNKPLPELYPAQLPSLQPTAPIPPPVLSYPAIITQSTSQTVTIGNPIWPCANIHPDGRNAHTDNSYWRAFDMQKLAGGAQYNVSAVSFGVELANNPQPVTVRLYRNSWGTFPEGVRTPIGSTTITVGPSESGRVVTVPLQATIPAQTSEVVMELFTPNGEADGNFFQVGSNSDPETGPSYWSSPCTASTPQVTNMHLVFSLHGSSSGETSTPPPTCPPVITQSTSQAITDTIMPCRQPHAPFAHTENSYWRAFNMGTFTGGVEYNVSSVSFGVQSAGQSDSVTIRLYKNFGGTFPGGTREQIATTTITVTSAQSGMVVTTPLMATVPVGTTQLVMELFTPDNNMFSVGANTAPETGPSYWSSPCTDNTPITTSTHIVFNVTGSCPQPVPPTLGNYPDRSILLGSDTTIPPDAAPANTTSINISTSTNFQGTLEGYPTTGMVRVTNAHPTGRYTITVRALNNAGLTLTKTFTLTVMAPAPCSPVNFAAANAFGVANHPRSVAVGDFNGDGRQDLAIASYVYSGTVSILLGDGAGNFSPATILSTYEYATSIAVGDFNGDGKQDLAVANWDTLDVTILLGDGLGGFGAATHFPVGPEPVSVAVGDFNGDGRQDLALARYDGNGVAILLGDGAGYFTPPAYFGAGALPQSVAVGDFNGDGKQDLALANSGSGDVSILLGDGAASFSPATNFPVGTSSYPAPYSVAVGDFNRDGKQDLVVANSNSDNVSILLGDGAGNFSPATNFPVGPAPYSVAVSDFNGDGNQDLVVAVSILNSVAILLGDGSGSFSAPIYFGASSGPRSVAVGDFNGDGQQDLAIGNYGSNNVSVALRDCGSAPITISGTISYCSNPVPGPVPNVTLTLTGTASGTTLSNSSGNYMFSVPSGGSYTVTPSKAPVTAGTFAINTTDVIAVQRHFLQIGTPLTGCRLLAADVNGDSLVNTIDVTAIQRFVLVLSTGTANVGNYKFTPINRTYQNITTNQTSQNYNALVFGDVAAPFVE